MSQSKPTHVEINTYAQSFIDCGDKSKSWVLAYPKSKSLPAGVNSRASEFHKRSEVLVRISELTVKTREIAEEKFSISVEERLGMLKDIYDAGMSTYLDMQGNKRRENLGASKSSIDTLNSMLGTDEDAGKVKPVKVMIGVKDASRS